MLIRDTFMKRRCSVAQLREAVEDSRSRAAAQPLAGRLAISTKNIEPRVLPALEM